MNFELKYKKALDWIHSIYPTLSGAAKEDAEHYFPELKDSEDERMKKSIIGHLNSIKQGTVICTTDTSKEIAWLEKQKETSKTTESIPSDCTATAKCLGRSGIWHFTKENDFPDSAREVLCRDAINNYFIGRFYGSGRDWEVSMYDDCDKTNEDNPPVVMWMDIPLVLSSEEMELNALAFLEQLGYTCIPNIDGEITVQIRKK